MSPWLPDWLPRLAIRDVPIGRGTVAITVARRGERTVVEEARGDGIDVVEGTAPAALWGPVDA